MRVNNKPAALIVAFCAFGLIALACVPGNTLAYPGAIAGGLLGGAAHVLWRGTRRR